MATIFERFEMTIKSKPIFNMLTGIEIDIYLEEQGLKSEDTYDNAAATLNKIEKAALQALEDIANNPDLMKDYKVDTESYSNFHTNLRKRIDQLRNRVNSFSINKNTGNSSSFLFYK
ncbi:hypothetical protein [Aneurinibacillus tyrosinisolvens]|uniref:hypothetical protein n=1 Tax=Aneurinibacillus tyrosinisolvens TaxID=1443435 RepID=UPI00069B0969|nr:hypothetical protein [Aneurinibacillus tyrosinisolvens]